MNRKKFPPLNSLKARLLFLSIGMTILAVSVMTLIAVEATRTAGAHAQEISNQAVRAQAEEYLLQLTQRGAKENDLMLERVEADVNKIAYSASLIFSSPNNYPGNTFWPVDQHMSTGPDGQYMNGSEDISSVFVPKGRTIDEDVRRDIELSAYLDLILASTFKNNPSAEAIYFATPREMVRYYPNVKLGEVLPPDFLATQRVWYTGSTQQNDPNRNVWWTPIYLDATGLGLVTTAAAPVYNENDELVGVVGYDVTLNDMKAGIESSRSP